jgi:hypothetical protein
VSVNLADAGVNVFGEIQKLLIMLYSSSSFSAFHYIENGLITSGIFFKYNEISSNLIDIIYLKFYPG